jgi:tRNA nucleotidyltransferase/poly(A) polymerase
MFPHSIETGVDYGTVTVRLGGGRDLFEVTTLRCDQEYLDGRRPESVKFGKSLSEDLERRDLTINAMAIDLARQQLYDPFDGLQDLQNGVLRAVGDASLRLGEDGLRVMRVYRFMDQGEAGLWQPEGLLSAALVECREMLANVSVERIWDEFQKILSGNHAADVLARMHSDAVLSTIFSGHDYDLNGQSNLIGVGRDSVVAARLAMMFLSANPTSLLKQLKVSKSITNDVIELRRRMTHLPNSSEITELRLYRAVLGERLTTQLACEVALGTPNANDIKSALSVLSSNQAGDSALANGNWIVEVTGIEPGIRLGRLKALLHRIQVENDLTSLDEIESRLAEIDWQNDDPLNWPQFAWSGK